MATSEPTTTGDLLTDLRELAEVAEKQKWLVTARVCLEAAERIEELEQKQRLEQRILHEPR